MMNSLQVELQQRLAALEPETLIVHDDSAAHAGHAGSGGGGHFEVTIVAQAFAGLGKVARHRKVYALVADLMPARVHALSIKALTPDEL
ncbi:BolA protein [Silvimonas terrae]|uniref:BolA protein n=1 Tax=Silvimonas terrae TaxID=300266 RepID=A0A840RAB6_9NEIS|nr:BolA family protein [Silvimonas terrae]MBB5190339.1 BolA protein [Silvimonas terrae]